MSARILSGTVFDRLPDIEPGTVDICCTSPPYWRLRSYIAADHPLKKHELGCELTVNEYVANVVKWMRLVRDALADHGTVWLNLGDTYSHAQGKRKPGDKHGPKQTTNYGSVGTFSASADNVENGSLCLIPQRVAIALQDDGWLLRSIIIWQKPSAMPASIRGWRWERCKIKCKASATSQTPYTSKGPKSPQGLTKNGGIDGTAQWQDCPGCKKCESNDGYVLRKGSWRPTSSYEPILMLAKTDDYFCDGEPVKTPPAASTISRDKYTRVIDDPDEQFAVAHDHETMCNGANLRDVWRIAAEPLHEKHYASFPSELVRRCLLAGTSAEGYCSTCSTPWVRVVESEGLQQQNTWTGSGRGKTCPAGGGHYGRTGQWNSQTTLMGWKPSCSCKDNTPRPALVLDPFTGSGRTATVATAMGLDFIGVELNPDFVDLANRMIRKTSRKLPGAAVVKPTAVVAKTKPSDLFS